jgi:AmmeMemoRadiSam system radical SAM enzyme/AmmeMemoRadiSam system protein B/AmmeMemoRadiSam system protein A
VVNDGVSEEAVPMREVVLPPPVTNVSSAGEIRGGWWHEDMSDGRIVCDLCPRTCRLGEGDRGFCFVRQNRDGEMLLTTYGRSTGFCIDPIEKKPLNHFYPGTPVLSFGTAGCNLGCQFCQNWDISKSREVERLSELALPETIAEAAVATACRSVAFTYNDPVIWAEYAIDTALACRARGIHTVAVTAGYIMPAVRPAFFGAMDAANIDLKAFTEDFYQKITYSHLQPVLDTLTWLQQESDVWFEITNLLIPDLNDSDDELRQMCDWIVQSIGSDVPVHFTAFHPDFRMRDRPATPVDTLLRAREIALNQGLRFVYVGNVHDSSSQNTWCPACGTLLIERDWYLLGTYGLRGNRCGKCGERIPGHFDSEPGTWGAKRQPIRISDYGRTPPRPSDKREPSAMQQTEHAVSDQTDSDRPELTEQQRAAIHRAACEIVSAAAQHTDVRLSDATLAGAAETKVVGAFVTIRRDRQLRGCCGMLGRPQTLLAALSAAGQRTAVDDPRFPPVSASEFPYLDLEVTLLFHFQPLSQQGSARVQEIEIGRHGLRIQRGQQAGLLLPSVPVEHGWDAETFLRQLCRKAGLPVTAWKDPDAQLTRFEGLSIAGSFDAGDVTWTGNGLLPDAAQLNRLQLFTRRNLCALAAGAVPACFPPESADGSVAGIVLQLHDSRSGRSMILSRRQARGELPLQSTLLELTQAAARRVSPDHVDDVRVDICLMQDATTHGTLDQPDLRGISPANRAVVVGHADRAAIVFDPSRTPEQLVQHAASLAGVQDGQAASVHSYAVACTASSLEFSNTPVAVAGTQERVAAVAGTFYPAEAARLNELLEQCLGTLPETKERWPAAMVPHAGLQYSGRIAADVLKRIQIPDTAIIIGPKHTRLGVDWAVAPHTAWQTPIGSVAAELSLAETLAARIDGLQLDAAAHAREHAIEVELPLLLRLAPATRIAAIVVGGGSLQQMLQFGRQLADLIRGLPAPPLLLISSDMNHFASDTENRRLDEMALAAMQTCQPERLYDVVTSNGISMCGVLPAVIVMEALRQLQGLQQVVRVSYGTSGDVSLDRSRVVGYAGMLLG